MGLEQFQRHGFSTSIVNFLHFRVKHQLNFGGPESGPVRFLALNPQSLKSFELRTPAFFLLGLRPIFLHPIRISF